MDLLQDLMVAMRLIFTRDQVVVRRPKCSVLSLHLMMVRRIKFSGSSTGSKNS